MAGGAELSGVVHGSRSPRLRSPGGCALAELADSAIEYRKKSHDRGSTRWSLGGPSYVRELRRAPLSPPGGHAPVAVHRLSSRTLAVHSHGHGN